MDAPHVVLLPFPAQGHIKPVLMLAQLLCHGAGGFNITFVNTEHNHRRLLNLIDQTAFSRRFPTLQFMSIPDGLSPEHPRTGPSLVDLFFSTSSVSKPEFRNLIVSLSQEPTCIIADGIMSFAIDVADELGIPVITFRTYSATCTWIYFHLQKLIRDGEIPVVEGNGDMDKHISCISGLENILRRRDLPNICRLEPDNPILQFYITQASKMARASALILNTFQELETPIISHLQSIFPTVYTIGPLHLHTLIDSPSKNSSSLIQIDESCIKWLDSRHPKSVLYVSFGSVIVLSHDQLLEFWYGLVNSGKPFLWAIRPDLVVDNEPNKIPDELKMATKERGCIVSWAPQEDVLSHQAIGGFLTHSGWNSTLESITFGVPMICWPMIVDQQVNSRCVSEIWKVGFDMKDTCDRSTVEKLVRDLMEDKREEIMESTVKNARLAHDSILEGGSSHGNIKKLVQDIISIHSSKNESKGNE
ncbi:UDP-glycosyltransferase 85A2 [Forsythia ovata]|uniref:Glycosyltransferase n=1 Tax=Forsythia ovata TaxID=205694 RepID=A0ABD1X203_9LAMI